MVLSKKDNFRIIVEPKRLGDYGFFRTSDTHLRSQEQVEKDYISRCKEIIEDITRHVDNVNDAYLEYDIIYTCSHCGWGLNKDEINNPQCCKAAIDEVNDKSIKLCMNL